jgi:lipopolysaccharide export system permease protein
MIKRVDRYVGKAVLLGILTVWSIVLLLAVMFNVLGELRSTTETYTALDAMHFVFLITPRTAYQIFPVCALMGAMVGVGGLAAANELVAFRTSGVSRLRLAGAALAGTLLITLPVMAMAEWVAPASEQQARVFRLGKMIGQYIIGGPRGLWLRDGDRMVNIRQPIVALEEGRQTVQFGDILMYDFDEGGSLRSVSRAERALHDGDRWEWLDIRTLSLSKDEIRQETADRGLWQTHLQPELVDNAVNRPQHMSIGMLWGQMQYMSANGLDNRIYRSNLFSRALFPGTVLALVLAGMPFVFASGRNQKLGVRLFFGMTLGVVFTIVNRMMQNLGEAYGVTEVLTVIGPSVALAIAAMLVLRRSV